MAYRFLQSGPDDPRPPDRHGVGTKHCDLFDGRRPGTPTTNTKGHVESLVVPKNLKNSKENDSGRDDLTFSYPHTHAHVHKREYTTCHVQTHTHMYTHTHRGGSELDSDTQERREIPSSVLVRRQVGPVEPVVVVSTGPVPGVEVVGRNVVVVDARKRRPF